jgi:hypothetical protein
MSIFLALALAPVALANGQTTHIWITRHALEHLPDGELRDLLQDPANEAALIHGSMFPDGGYAIDHGYGEVGHWEPFQARYLAWIQAHHPAPFDDEGAQHVAFLLGMGSHGMADQTFDAFYFNWSSIKDAEYGWAAGDSFDEASDFVWAAQTGAQTVPDRWMPDTTLVELYAEHGVEVDTQSLSRGQGWLETAVGMVGLGSVNEPLVQSYAEQFPWGSAHLADESLPGTPACEGVWVARYWESLYARLTDTADPRSVLGTWPLDGGFEHPLDHTTPEARVSFVFPVGAAEDTASAEWFRLETTDGDAVPFDTWLYYGRSSHVVHLVPEGDWLADTDYVATALAGLPYRDGSELAEDSAFGFSTRDAPVPAAGGTDKTAPDNTGCATATGRSSGWSMALGALGVLVRRRKRAPHR